MPLPKFEPWRPLGPDPRVQGVRLLILGESHYAEDDCWPEDAQPWMTNYVVTRYGVLGEPQRFFTAVFEAVTGHDRADAESFSAFWRSIYFYNYVTTFVSSGDNRKRPTPQQFAESGPDFLEVLENIRPDAIAVFGSTTWNNMTEERARKANVAVPHSDVWLYRLSDGSEIPAAHTCHPSARASKFVMAHARETIAGLLDMARNRS